MARYDRPFSNRDCVEPGGDITIARCELGRFPKPEILEKIAAAAKKLTCWVIEDISKDKEQL